MKALVGFAMTAGVVLLVIFLFNKFSGKNVAALGAGSPSAAK